MKETQGHGMGQRGLVPGGHLIITSKTQTLPQSTIPIIPTTIQIAGMTGGTGETAWALGQVTTATRDTATTTILTITMAAAAAEEAAMTGTGTETEIEIGTERGKEREKRRGTVTEAEIVGKEAEAEIRKKRKRTVNTIRPRRVIKPQKIARTFPSLCFMDIMVPRLLHL